MLNIMHNAAEIYDMQTVFLKQPTRPLGKEPTC